MVNYYLVGFADSASGKESTCQYRRLRLIPGLGRSPGEGNGNPRLFLPGKFRGAWWATIHGVAESAMTEHTHPQWMNNCFFKCFCHLLI